MIKNLFKSVILFTAFSWAVSCSEQEFYEWNEPVEDEEINGSTPDKPKPEPNPNPNPNPNPSPEPEPQPQPDPEKPSGYAGRIEMPELLTGENYPFVTHTTSVNGKNLISYSYQYDCQKHHTRWVAFTFSTATPDNGLGRKGSFKEDPKLPTAHRLDENSYKNSGYSRGHLVASSDRQYSIEANKQTFYMSNMSPQIQNGFNGGIWNSLEKKVQSWGHGIKNNQDTLYVVKGGTINDDQIVKYLHDGNKKIAVPKYYFMALLWLKNGQYKAIGFWLEHKAYSNSNSYPNYTVSIAELEKKTGINFFPNLPNEIETAVEKSYNKSDWGL